VVLTIGVQFDATVTVSSLRPARRLLLGTSTPTLFGRNTSLQFWGGYESLDRTDARPSACEPSLGSTPGHRRNRFRPSRLSSGGRSRASYSDCTQPRASQSSGMAALVRSIPPFGLTPPRPRRDRHRGWPSWRIPARLSAYLRAHEGAAVIVCRDLVLMPEHYSRPCEHRQCH
jgi:hypothetical protein